MGKQLILILGGARAGKSDLAEKLARGMGDKVLFVATAEAKDRDMARRIAAHRRQRPPTWDVIEEPLDIAGKLAGRRKHADVVLLDCLTLWVSNMLLRDGGAAEESARAAARRLLDVYGRGSSSWIVVSNEVGLGVVPPTRLGRAYRDTLGRVNQIFASRADHVYMAVAGLSFDLRALDPRDAGKLPGPIG